MTLYMTRTKAFVTHLVVSLLIFSSVIVLVGLVWYPGLFFEASGVWHAMRMVAIVDVVLGPLLTLVLFKPGKPGLKFDITLVVVLQLSALLYGVWVLYSQKPALVVFDQGMFYCMNDAQTEYAGVPDELLRLDAERRQAGQRIAIALFPALNAEQQQQWQQLRPQLPADYPKLASFALGQLLQPYDEHAREQVLEQAWNLAGQINSSARAADAWQGFVAEYGDRHDQHRGYRFYPLTCGFKQYMVALQPEHGTLDALLNMSFINARQYRLIKPALQATQ